MSVEELRRAALALFRHLEECGQNEVEIAEDYYWEVAASGRYNPYEEPEAHTLGQLSDDWSELLQIASGAREPTAYGLVWLAAVLRRVGEVTPG